MRTLLLGVGPETRSDSAVGRVVAQQLAARGCRAEVRLATARILDDPECWAAHDRVIIIEGAADGRRPGTVHRSEHHGSTEHGGTTAPSAPTSVNEIIERVGHLPAHLEMLTVSIPDDDAGSGLSKVVQAAADRLVEELAGELAANRDVAEVWTPPT